MIIAFDLDDTLFSEFDFCRSAYKEIAKECGTRYGLHSRIIYESMMKALLSHSNPFDALSDICRGNIADIEDFNVKEWVEKYRKHKPSSLPLADGVAEVLDILKKSNIKLAVITDGRVNTQTAKFDSLGLGKYIDKDNLIISGSTGFDKTDAHNFKLLMERYPEEKDFIYIADNQSKDFFHPNLFGWHTICVRPLFPTVHPFIIPEDIRYRASSILGSISDIMEDKKIASGLLPTR